MQFYTAQEAAAFCERQGWEYEVRGGRPKLNNKS